MYNILAMNDLSRTFHHNLIIMFRLAFFLCTFLCFCSSTLGQEYFGGITREICNHGNLTSALDSAEVFSINSNSVTTTHETDWFIVEFTDFTTPGINSFLRACEVWESVLEITVPIHIEARWVNDDPLTLGTTNIGPQVCNFANAPLPDILYVPSLANQLAGQDLNPSDSDMSFDLNSQADWDFSSSHPGYYEGAPKDFQTVVLHEIGHGLGIAGTAAITVGVPTLGQANPFGDCWTKPNVYDHHVQLSEFGGTPIVDVDYLDLAAALTSENLFWNGSNATAVNGGDLVPLHSPAQWDPGSSYSHVAPMEFNDDLDYTNSAALMYPALPGGIRLMPTNEDLGMLEDIGWTITAEKQWFIPNPAHPEVDGNPAVFQYSPPKHYLRAKQSCMNPSVFAEYAPAEPTEVWDQSCRDAYDCCINQGCKNESACNYDPYACQDNPLLCRFCIPGAECVTIETSGSTNGWDSQVPGYAFDWESEVPFQFGPQAFWTIQPLGYVDQATIYLGSLTRPEGALAGAYEYPATQGQDGVCLAAGCYTYEVFYDNVEYPTFLASMGWQISGVNENNGVLAGGAGETEFPFSVGDAAVVEGCTDPEACNYNPDACIDDGSCDLTEGCTNVFACNFEPAACVDDGSCEFCYFSNCVTVSTNIIGFGSGNWSIVDESGTFPIGINGSSFTGTPAETTFCIDDGCYTFELNSSGGLFPNPLATWTIEGADGGTISGSGNASFQISFGGSGGCTDPVACNYNASACLDLDNCQYPGCNDPGACNYNPDAGDCGFVECEYSEVYVSITDNGSTGVVVYPEELGGCTNELAPNYDAGALFEDGSCILSYLCGPGTYYDMDLATCLPNSCLGDFDGSGDVATNDLLTFLGVYGQSCD